MTVPKSEEKYAAYNWSGNAKNIIETIENKTDYGADVKKLVTASAGFRQSDSAAVATVSSIADALGTDKDALGKYLPPLLVTNDQGPKAGPAGDKVLPTMGGGGSRRKSNSRSKKNRSRSRRR